MQDYHVSPQSEPGDRTSESSVVRPRSQTRIQSTCEMNSTEATDPISLHTSSEHDQSVGFSPRSQQRAVTFTNLQTLALKTLLDISTPEARFRIIWKDLRHHEKKGAFEGALPEEIYYAQLSRMVNLLGRGNADTSSATTFTDYDDDDKAPMHTVVTKVVEKVLAKDEDKNRQEAESLRTSIIAIAKSILAIEVDPSQETDDRSKEEHEVAQTSKKTKKNKKKRTKTMTSGTNIQLSSADGAGTEADERSHGEDDCITRPRPDSRECRDYKENDSGATASKSAQEAQVLNKLSYPDHPYNSDARATAQEVECTLLRLPVKIEDSIGEPALEPSYIALAQNSLDSFTIEKAEASGVEHSALIEKMKEQDIKSDKDQSEAVKAPLHCLAGQLVNAATLMAYKERVEIDDEARGERQLAIASSADQLHDDMPDTAELAPLTDMSGPSKAVTKSQKPKKQDNANKSYSLRSNGSDSGLPKASETNGAKIHTDVEILLQCKNKGGVRENQTELQPRGLRRRTVDSKPCHEDMLSVELGPDSSHLIEDLQTYHQQDRNVNIYTKFSEKRFYCEFHDCQALIKDEEKTLICDFCGYLANTRYCSNKCRLADAPWHYFFCGIDIIQELTELIERPLWSEGSRLLSNVHNYRNGKRQRQLMYHLYHASDYTIFIEKSSLPAREVQLYWPARSTDDSTFHWPTKRFIQRLLDAVFVDHLKLQNVRILYKMARHRLQKGQFELLAPFSEVLRALDRQFAEEFEFQIDHSYTDVADIHEEIQKYDWDGEYCWTVVSR